jgi:hypothetical protein
MPDAGSQWIVHSMKIRLRSFAEVAAATWLVRLPHWQIRTITSLLRCYPGASVSNCTDQAD